MTQSNTNDEFAAAGPSRLSVGSMNDDSSTNKRLIKRRVPDAKRRRTLVSCDRCKTRRMKCSRLEPDGPCQNCAQQGLECTSALPRKQRIHGSIESLSLRYRALEALVQGLTGQDIQDTDTLYRIASARGITMPSDQDTSYEARAFSSDALESISMSNSATGLAMSPHSATSPTSNPHLQPTSILCPSCAAAVVPLNIPDGKLMPAPHGISHYVGSASSFEFANAIRRLVAKVDRPPGLASQHANRANRTSQQASAYSSPRPQALMPSAPTSRQKLRAEFATSMRTSKALEPRDRSHPAAAVAAEDSNSQDSDDPAEGAASTVGSSTQVQQGMPGSAPEFGMSQSGSLPSQLGITAVESNAAATTTSTRQLCDHVSDIATPDSTRTNRIRRLLDILPTKAISDRLVDAFFDRVHPNYVVFHRGLFYRRYRAVWRHAANQQDPTAKAEAQENDAGWICSLLMVLVFGAQALEGQGYADAVQIQRRLLRLVVRERFQRLTFTASLSNVQALLLLQLYEHNAGERNAAWMLLGQAARMAIALGMHRETKDSGFDTVEQNLRRLVWWTLQQFEMNLSMALGRPSSMELVEITAQVPEEAIMDRNDFPPDYPLYYRKLVDISWRAKHLLARTSARYSNEQELLQCSTASSSVLAQLQEWYSQLPQHLSPDWPFAMPRQCRAVLLLLINYHHICAALARPFLLCKIEREIDCLQNPKLSRVSAIVSKLATSCLESARAILEMCEQLHQQDMLEGVVWLDCYYLHHAMLICSLPYLPRSGASDDVHEAEHKALLGRTSALVKNLNLAPTYLVLTKIATQLIHIVGIDDGSEPAQIGKGNQLNHEALQAITRPHSAAGHHARNLDHHPSLNSLELLLAAANVPSHSGDGSTFANGEEQSSAAQAYDPRLQDASAVNLSNLASMQHRGSATFDTAFPVDPASGQTYESASPSLNQLWPFQTSPNSELYSEFYQLGFESGSTFFTWDFFNVGNQGVAAPGESQTDVAS